MGTAFRGSEQENRALNTYIKLMRATETISVAVHQHLAKEKLTISQFGVLEALYHLGPMCQRDVAQKNLKSTANMTTVVDNLEKRGLAQRKRSSEDRRYITLHLTKRGRELIKRIFPGHVSGVVKAFNKLSSEEQDQLAHICKKIGLSDNV